MSKGEDRMTIPDDAAERLADKLRALGVVDPDDDTMPVFKDVEYDGYHIGVIAYRTGAVGIAEEMAKCIRSWASGTETQASSKIDQILDEPTAPTASTSASRMQQLRDARAAQRRADTLAALAAMRSESTIHRSRDEQG